MLKKCTILLFSQYIQYCLCLVQMSNWRWRNWKGHTKKKLIILIKENFASAKNTFASKYNMGFEFHPKRFKIKCEGNQKFTAVNSFNDFSPWKNSIEKICHKWVKQSSGLICTGNYFSYKNTQWYNKQKYWVWQSTDISKSSTGAHLVPGCWAASCCGIQT